MSGPGAERRLTRRQAIGAGAAGLIAVGAYGITRLADDGSRPAADLVLKAGSTEIELGKRRARTWAFGDAVPARPIRLRQGESVRIRVDNDLPQPTSVHWHGVRLRNPADGVPGFTQPEIDEGGSFVYEFSPPDAGTFFFHTHVGVQLDRGLYGALIVEPRREELDYDREAVLVLDDWLDGVRGTPDQQFKRLREAGMSGMSGGSGDGMDMGGGSGGMDMGGGSGGSMDMGGSQDPSMRGVHTALDGRPPGADDLARLANLMERGKVDVGDVRHPLHLINGRPPEDADQVDVRRGDRLRLRVVNAAADTTYCFFVEGHPLTVTHADGMPVEHVRTDALLLGMGERYDVLIDAQAERSARIFAMPLGKAGRAVAMLRYAGAAARPPAADGPFDAPPRIASYADLRDPEGPEPVAEARERRLDLGFDMPYRWTIGGQAFPKADVIEARRGERQRYLIRNRTTMPHPMHLHGHSFRLGPRGALKDTVVVPPRREIAIEWTANNPGAWAFHCHNAYHQEAGMMRKVRVV